MCRHQLCCLLGICQWPPQKLQDLSYLPMENQTTKASFYKMGAIILRAMTILIWQFLAIFIRTAAGDFEQNPLIKDATNILEGCLFDSKIWFTASKDLTTTASEEISTSVGHIHKILNPTQMHGFLRRSIWGAASITESLWTNWTIPKHWRTPWVPRSRITENL